MTCFLVGGASISPDALQLTAYQMPERMHRNTCRSSWTKHAVYGDPGPAVKAPQRNEQLEWFLNISQETSHHIIIYVSSPEVSLYDDRHSAIPCWCGIWVSYFFVGIFDINL